MKKIIFSLLFSITVVGNVSAQNFDDIAKKVGLERIIFCYFVGADLEQKNGYGLMPAAKIGRAVRIVYINLLKNFPSNQIETTASVVAKEISTMTMRELTMAPLKCSDDPSINQYIKENLK